MSSLTTAVATYSYLSRPALDLGSADAADAALLAQIDAMLSSAADSFNARQYDEAITSYHAAESLIYAHLDPQWIPEMGPRFRRLLPRDPALFDPLLSAASQWLNILAVPTPTSPVQPSAAPSPALFGSVAGLHGAGLASVSANPAATAAAISAIRLASIYSEQGNAVASDAASARAKTLDAATAGALAAPTPASPPAPAPAAPAPVAAPIQALSPALLTAGRQSLLVAKTSLATQSFVGTIEKLPTLPIAVLAQKQVGLPSLGAAGFTVSRLQWAVGASPDPMALKSLIYAPHATATVLPDALGNATTLWERAANLAHDYFYVVPLALAQCYQAMGDFAQAETYYLQVAVYAFLNTPIEGPYVWVGLADLYRAWGDNLYRQGDTAGASGVYAKVVSAAGAAAPATPLYTLTGLATATTIAKTLLPQLSSLAANGATSLAPDDVAIAAVMLRIFAKQGQIAAGLDFWGADPNTVPIWTFRYLQQVAINFTQLALQAEQQVISYWSQADQAALTKTELTNQVAQANGQVAAAQQHVQAAQVQAQAFQAGLTLAQARAADAKTDATQYAAVNSQVIIIQATGQQVSGGDDGDYQGVSDMANQYLSGQTISGDSATVAAATQLAANRLSQQYQVDSMNRTASEMQLAATQAQAQLTAANAQITASQANLAVAMLQANGAAQTLSVFDANTFTPQVWRSMGNYLDDIYQRYMDMSLQAAKLMQQAYNFENDTTLSVIKSYYSGVVEGLLAADALMADIQSFTDDLVTASRGKRQLLKTSISLAGNYGYLFETQLRKTGTMAFETTLDDFDTRYPGSYQGRIRKVTVDVQGIVPPSGVAGFLSNNGISVYRLPADIATSDKPDKLRIQNAETLVISDYDAALDGVLDSSVGGQSGIFEGAGVASSWTLSLPPALNDIDYGTLTDVVLTFLYEARFDAQLTPTVLAQLAARPGYYTRERSIPLAWLYPDLFYGFLKTGSLTLGLAAADFALNQTKPMVTAVSLLAAMKPGVSAQGVTVSLTAPGKAALTGVTGADGSISSQGAGSAWAGAGGGSALGDWVLSVTAGANPALAPGGVLDLSSLINLVLVLDYSFRPRG